jgi:acyl-coenzyme A synthetase/AMP-(fatty) acid ligase
MLRTTIQRHIDDRPNSLALISADGSRSWKELADEIDDFIGQLKQLRPVGRLLIRLPQNGTAVSLITACEAAKLDIILVPDFYSESKAVELLDSFDAGQLISLEASRVIQVAKRDKQIRIRSADMDASVFLLTSGTTGHPKCARHSWATLSNGMSQLSEREPKRWMIGYSVAQLGGVRLFLYCLLKGHTTVIPFDYSPRSAINALIQYSVYGVGCTPTYLRRLLNTTSPHELSVTSLQHISLGGEVVDAGLLAKIAELAPGAKVTQVYGSTETGAITIVVKDGKPGFDPSLLDGKRLQTREGELLVRRSATAMIGYLNEHNATDEWISTGDLIEVRDGRALFIGRRDEMINVGGAKVSPLIVESLIRQVEGVIDAKVTAHPSSIVGNVVRADVVINHHVDRDIISSTIRRYCASKLPDYMAPRIIKFSDPVLHDTCQKQIRGKLE